MRARLADTAAAKQADVVQAREARRERALHSRAALLARRGDDGAGTDTTVTDGGSESAPEVENDERGNAALLLLARGNAREGEM